MLSEANQQQDTRMRGITTENLNGATSTPIDNYSQVIHRALQCPSALRSTCLYCILYATLTELFCVIKRPLGVNTVNLSIKRKFIETKDVD